MRAETIVLEPRIATPRLLLRPPMEDDIDGMAEAIDDIEIVRMLARVPYPYRREDAIAFLGSARESAARGTDVNLVIVRDDRIIGCVGLADVGKVNELGYWLGRADWSQGLATEAARAFLGWCFASLDIDAVRSGAFSDNPASLRVQLKLGFEAIGTSHRPSLARGRAVEHIDTILTRARFAETAQ